MAVVDNLNTSKRFELVVQADDVVIPDNGYNYAKTTLESKLGRTIEIIRYTG